MLNGAAVLTDIGAAKADIKSSAADKEVFIPLDDAKASRDFTLTAPASAPATSETSNAALCCFLRSSAAARVRVPSRERKFDVAQANLTTKHDIWWVAAPP